MKFSVVVLIFFSGAMALNALISKLERIYDWKRSAIGAVLCLAVGIGILCLI